MGRWLERVKLPLVPIAIGAQFPLNYACAKVVQWLTGAQGGDILASDIPEVKEFVFGLLFLFIAVEFLVVGIGWRDGPAPSEPAAPEPGPAEVTR